MVKIAENPQIIHKDRYYLWSYIPDSTGRYSRVTKHYYSANIFAEFLFILDYMLKG